MIYYFAYGANRNPEMIEAIIGRKPKGFVYILRDYELCIQEWGDISPRVKRILEKVGWGKSFKSYSIRYARGKEVQGRIWEISKKEHKHIANWEMHNLWYSPIRKVKKINGKKRTVQTEVINDKNIKGLKDQYGYKDFPVNKHKILSIARKVRTK